MLIDENNCQNITFANASHNIMKSLLTLIRFWFYIALEKFGLRRSSPSRRSRGKEGCR